MHYYRKAAAIFILVIALILPFFLKVEKETAVVDLENIVEASSYLDSFKKSSLEKIREKVEKDKGESAGSSQTQKEVIQKIEKEIIAIIRESSSKLADKNNYSTILIKDSVYRGGNDITIDLANKIDSIHK